MAMQTNNQTNDNEIPLTRAAYEEMQRELDHLRTVGRREVAEEVRQAWDSEFDKDEEVAVPVMAAKEDQAMLEGRIAALEETLARATLIDEAAARASDTVQIGSVVVLVHGEGTEHVYQIVSSAESDPSVGKLNSESPVGAAVLGKRAGDAVEVETPSGTQRLQVKELR